VLRYRTCALRAADASFRSHPTAGKVAFPGNSLYHASKWGIEGFVESVAQEVASFGIGMTIVEPGGARTEFRYGSAQVAKLTPIPPAACNSPACSWARGSVPVFLPPLLRRAMDKSWTKPRVILVRFGQF
jgi:NAD(P)-dependent dehydrogenase (short-subunit alcohol dehydrogenase family)